MSLSDKLDLARSEIRVLNSDCPEKERTIEAHKQMILGQGIWFYYPFGSQFRAMNGVVLICG